METMGKYDLLEKLGDGTLGAVYKAHDRALNRFVALITLAADPRWDPAAKETFDAECRSLLNVKHPNLAVVYEQGVDRKILYIVTELLLGPDLRRLIVENVSMTVERKLRIMIQVASGLGHAHTKGVLHRNLHPGNIHLLPDDKVKVDGFGFSLHPASCGAGVRGEPASNLYLSPEQLLGNEASRQSDIFSAGLVLYEFLTGVHPFHESENGKTLDNIRNMTHFPTIEQFPNLPMNLWPILERCLAKEAEERYQSMQDLGAACQGVLEELAEDSDWMRIELQTALPRLRRAGRKKDAPAALGKLQGEIDRALLHGDALDYQSLNRLVLALAEHHRLLEGSAEATSPFRSESTDPEPVDGMLTGQPEAAAPSNGILDASFAPPAPMPLERAVDDLGAGPQPAPDLDTHGQEMPGKEADSPPPRISPHTAEDTSEKGSSQAFPKPANSPAAASSHAPARADAELSPAAKGRKDNLSELLRKIDQGQESTRKLVDSFLAGRQATAAAKPKGQEDGGRPKTASVETNRAALAQPLDPSRPGMEAKLARAQMFARQIKPAGAHPSPAADLIDVTADVSAALPRRGRRKTALWICASTLVLAMAFAIPWVRNRVGAGAGRDAASGKKPLHSAAQTDDPVAVAIRNQLNFARRDILLEEAEVLHTIGRREESLVFLNRLLELYPGYAPAQQELDLIKAETVLPEEEESRRQSVQKLLGSALAAIRAGNLQKARADLDKADQLQPGLQETAGVRKRLEAKKTEMSQQIAREQEDRAAEQRQTDAETLARHADDLYRQGKYTEALTIVEEQLTRPSPSPHMQELRSRITEVQRNLKTYENALNAGSHAEARAALDKIERINPEDPNLPNLRRRTEAVPGTVALSMFPIAELAALMLDDQPVGTNGELINHTISSGRHKLSARGSDGREVALTQDFANGTTITMVYDVAGRVLRGMNEADRLLVSKVKARQQVYRFAVEHPHGLFRGSCKGELIIDYHYVVYQPATGPHGFSVPFRNLTLKVENKTALLLFVADKSEFFSFKIADIPTAQKLSKAWDDLTALAFTPAPTHTGPGPSFQPD